MLQRIRNPISQGDESVRDVRKFLPPVKQLKQDLEGQVPPLVKKLDEIRMVEQPDGDDLVAMLTHYATTVN